MASLDDIRQALFDEADWDPGASAEAVRRVNGFIDRACQDLALDAPFLFPEAELRFQLAPNVEPTLATDTLSVPTDPTIPSTPRNSWILEADLERGTASAVVWKNDRTWDGRRIDLLDPTSGDVVHRSDIQSVSFYTDGGFDGVRIALTTPVPHETLGNGPFNWRVYTPVYWLPDDVITWKSGVVNIDGSEQPLNIDGLAAAEELGLIGDIPTASPGTPFHAWRVGHLALQGPNTAPAVTQENPDGGEDWLGPDVPGKFSYCITYTWGKRAAMYQLSGPGVWSGDAGTWLNAGPGSGNSNPAWTEDRLKEPLWESAPSPVSAEIDTGDFPGVGVGTALGAIKVELPNIEFHLGYLLAGTFDTGGGSTAYERISTGLSGWHVRIWRRRHTARFTDYHRMGTAVLGNSIDSLTKLDISDAYELLAEMPIDDVNAGIFYDRGQILPDHRRRLRDIHGYQGIRIHPPPDQAFEVKLRCVRRPPRLVNGADVPKLAPEAIELIIAKAGIPFYKMLKDPGSSAAALASYNDGLEELRNRYGDARPRHRPSVKRAARAGARRRPGFRWWRRVT